jgi:hypothetical protein
MKTFQNPSQFAFTNRMGVSHFNQSLLKSRIAMMNREKSKWLGLGKYGVFIGMLWLCAAFTKPYRVKVAAKIVEKVPELKMVFERPTASLPSIKDLVFKEPVAREKQEVIPITSIPQDTFVSQTKYVIYKDNKLHWVVTPTMDFEEFLAIHEEFEKVGATFFVKQTKYDPLHHHLLGMNLKTSFLKDGEDCYTEISGVRQEPIAAFGGWVAIEGGTAEISKTSFDSQFGAVVAEDKEKVDKWVTAHWSEYRQLKQEEERLVIQVGNNQGQEVRKRFYSNPLKTPNGITEFYPDALQYLCQMGARNRIYFEERQLRIENLYKSSDFILNNQPTTLQQVEKLTIDEIRYVVSYALYTDSTRQSAHRSLYIFTKDSIKP